MKPDDYKSLIKDIGGLVDARAKTTETLIKGEVRSLHEKIDATKEELRAEILAARAEAKVDNLHLAGKVDTMAKSHERRFEALEEKTETANPNKN